LFLLPVMRYFFCLGWKPNTRILLAANSLGTISIMQLE
jgi:hypothetical protein